MSSFVITKNNNKRSYLKILIHRLKYKISKLSKFSSYTALLNFISHAYASLVFNAHKFDVEFNTASHDYNIGESFFTGIQMGSATTEVEFIYSNNRNE